MLDSTVTLLFPSSVVSEAAGSLILVSALCVARKSKWFAGANETHKQMSIGEGMNRRGAKN